MFNQSHLQINIILLRKSKKVLMDQFYHQHHHPPKKLFLYSLNMLSSGTLSALDILAHCQWGSKPDSHPHKLTEMEIGDIWT